uniref:Uncharacterized protein n=1 Tax=Caulobacter phage BL57 TaxID=3348355 RepID=A0AB74UMF5_9VIRU
MIFYGIRQKKTGWYLPQAKRWRERSMCLAHAEPAEKEPPQMWPTEAGAWKALRHYVKGRIVVAKDANNSLLASGPVLRTFKLAREDVGRRLEDYEVVPLRIDHHF